VERKKLILGLFAAFLMATSTVGFVLSLGSFKPSNVEYQGRCLGTVLSIKDSRWLIYTLQDLNIPGTRNGPYIDTVPTEEVQRIVKELNLLYWTDAEVNVSVEGYNFTGLAFVLGNREPGDAVLLDCYAVISNGRPAYFYAIEIPAGS